jgi:hypothetical protein
MKTIGLIDDKDKSRRAFMLKLNLELEKSYPTWKIIDSKPFKDQDDYRQWILENEISVLITDERLDEEKLSDGSYVSYFGSDLVKKLREFFKDIPIYCITNIEITDNLRKSLSYFNLILSRKKFDDDVPNFLNLFIKSGTSFYTEFQKELTRLGELSNKYAEGSLIEAEKKEILSLQTRLLIPHLTSDLASREHTLNELEKKIEEIKSFHDELKKHLKD